jgi:hypothetical protein
MMNSASLSVEFNAIEEKNEDTGVFNIFCPC